MYFYRYERSKTPYGGDRQIVAEDFYRKKETAIKTSNSFFNTFKNGLNPKPVALSSFPDAGYHLMTYQGTVYEYKIQQLYMSEK